MATVKEKTIKGVIWSAIDNFSGQIILFLANIVLARLLSPREFGLIGMISIFIAISQTFIESGFANALIRKKDCTQTDYSTVFFYNLAIGGLFAILLFFSASFIGVFFNEPKLAEIIQVLSLLLIISAFAQIQRTILTKNVNFKLQTKISLSSNISSGIIAIIMAYNGFGVWSLVAMQISKQGINTILLWFLNRWRPTLVFSLKSFKELFSFGSKLLLSGIIDTFYQNVYYLIIGKYFSAVQLGYYTRANQFKDLTSQNITGIISRVTYPVLSQLQEDKAQLKNAYKRIIKITMFVSFVLMIGMASSAEPMIISILGEKWRASIVYLQLLCFVGMMYPLHALNLNMLNVLGRSDLFLKLEIIKKILAVPTIIIGIIFGIKAMILGMWFNTLFAYYLNSYWSGKFINYPILEQIKDIIPSLIIAGLMGCITFIFGEIVQLAFWLKFVLQILIGASVVLIISEFSHFETYLYIKGLIIKHKK